MGKNEKNGWYHLDKSGEIVWTQDKVDEFYKKFKIEKVYLQDFDFENFIFPGEFDWRKICGDSEILREVNFSHVDFLGDVDFSFIKFLGPVHVFSARFASRVNFHGASFLQDVDFHLAEFYGFCNFFLVKFHGSVDFSGVKFHECVTFEHSGFYKSASFIDVLFAKVGIFSRSFFSMDYELRFENSRAIKDQKLDFSDISSFGSKSIFRRYDFSQTTFLNTKIDKIFFDECIFPKKDQRMICFDEFRARTCHISIDGQDFKILGEKNFDYKYPGVSYEQLESLYCQLKSNFEDKKSWQLAGNFHISEMEMRRKRLEYEANKKWNNWLMKNLFFVFNNEWWVVMPERITLFFYRAISNYGESIGRPFVWILLFMVIVSCSITLISHKPLLDSFLIGFRSMTFQKEDDFGQLPVTIKWILSFANIIGVLLIAMLSLAVSRKTKR